MILIDDLDTVNEQSQQVFRHYIDNFSKNVHFVFVCTNIQKVIESIQSRSHTIKLKSLDKKQRRDTLDHIVLNEGIQISDEATEYLLSSCNDSVRILIGFLEKLYLHGEYIDINTCKLVCNCISVSSFESYIDAFNRKDIVTAVKILQKLYHSGYSVIDIFDYFFTFLKNTETVDDEIKYKIIPHLCKYIMIFHNYHEGPIILSFFTNRIFQDIHT